MATLGYVFPKKNQEELMNEIEQSIKNYKNDLLRQTFSKKPQIQTTTMAQIMPQVQIQTMPRDDAITPKSIPVSPTRVTRNLGLVAELLNNPRFKSRQVSEASTPNLSSGQVSPSGTEISMASSQQMSEYVDQLDTIKDPAGRENILNSAYEFLKSEIKSGAKIFAATGGNQKRKVDSNLLEIRGDDLYLMNNKPFDKKNISATFRINLIQSVGSGLKDNKYLGKAANLGKFYINLNSLRKGNVAIYRPKSNMAYLHKKSVSPKLVKIIQQIRQEKTFDISEYEELKDSEKLIADKIINLAQVDYPAKMKRSLDETIWNLKQRYEILLGSYNAGNDGKLVVDELKEVLNKLLKHRAISRSKHDYIVKALN